MLNIVDKILYKYYNRHRRSLIGSTAICPCGVGNRRLHRLEPHSGDDTTLYLPTLPELVADFGPDAEFSAIRYIVRETTDPSDESAGLYHSGSCRVSTVLERQKPHYTINSQV